MKHDPEVLKTATPDDLNRLSEILLEGFGKHDDVAANTPAILEASDADVLVSRTAGRLIASTMIVNIVYSTSGLAGRIDNVATHPDSMRRGHAAALLDFALEKWFKPRHVTHISLESEDERLPAHRLYESRGFKIYDTNQFELFLR